MESESGSVIKGELQAGDRVTRVMPFKDLACLWPVHSASHCREVLSFVHAAAAMFLSFHRRTVMEPNVPWQEL